MPKTQSKSRKKTASKKVKKSDLAAFTKGQDYLDMMEEEGNASSQKTIAFLTDAKEAAKKEIFNSLVKKRGKKKVFKPEPKTALVLLFATDLNGEKELFPREGLFRLLEGLLVLDVKVVVIDTQQPADLNNLGEFAGRPTGHITWYNPQQDNSGQAKEEKEIDRLLLAADLAILFNHHADLVQLLMHYGVVTVADENCPLLSTYKPNEETGNAFLFKKRDLWSIFATVVKALETFRFPFDWKHIIRNMQK
jgi:hypothetical protein